MSRRSILIFARPPIGAGMACARAVGKLRNDCRGAVAVEYGFLIALVVLAVMASIAGFGQANLDVWTNIAAKVKAAT